MAPPLLTWAAMVRNEHREFDRVPVSGTVRYWSWNEPRQAQALELSGGGIFVKTADPLPEGAHVTVRVEVPGKGGLTVLGQVVRTVKGGMLAVAGMGIRFLDLLPSQRRLITDFVASRQVA